MRLVCCCQIVHKMMVKLHLNNQHQNSRKVRVFNKVQLQVVWFSGRSCREAAAALPVRTLSPPAFFLQPSQTNSLTFRVGFPTVPQQKCIRQDEELPFPTVLTKWHEQSSLCRHMSHAILPRSTMISNFVTLWLLDCVLGCSFGLNLCAFSAGPKPVWILLHFYWWQILHGITWCHFVASMIETWYNLRMSWRRIPFM